MKIAIQGHPFRGNEVVEILKSFGGKSIFAGLGFNERYYYYINSNNIIRESLITIKTKEEFKLYTLEEFEKEFPFKIGDLCIYQSEYAGDIVVKVLRMIIQDNDIVYEIGHKDSDKTYSGIYRRRDTLKPYKKMKEERNVTLTFDKAKEWYKKGGELKEIALQAFTEKELNPLPKSWEEYCMTHGCVCLSARYTNISTKYNALIKLEQLRDCWRQGWKPTPGEIYYVIKLGFRGLDIYRFCTVEFLSFPTREMAEEFLKCFRDLIEKAGDLI